MKRFLNTILMALITGPLYAQDAGSGDNDLLYWYRNFDNHASYDLLDLALKKTEDFKGPAKIVRTPYMTQGRAVVELESGHRNLIRLINVVGDETREQNMIPIRIATDGGLVGMRVCIIRRDDQERFRNIRSHKDIVDNGIVFGQGVHWPDTRILESNSFPVVTSARFENLYKMLKEKRFNCFLRGANEAQEDLNQYVGNDLMIEPGLLFAYPSASFFFVSKDDKKLAARVELGLRRAIADGSFGEHVQRYYSSAVSDLQLQKRRIIRLNNPLLSDELLQNSAEKLHLSDGKFSVY